MNKFPSIDSYEFVDGWILYLLSGGEQHDKQFKQLIKQISCPISTSCYRSNEIWDCYEQGVTLGADATARQNGSVGGEITKRLVKQAQSQLGASQNQQ